MGRVKVGIVAVLLASGLRRAESCRYSFRTKDGSLIGSEKETISIRWPPFLLQTLLSHRVGMNTTNPISLKEVRTSYDGLAGHI